MEDLINTIIHIDVWMIGKIFVLLALGVYVVFSFVVVRQVKLMTEVVSGMMTNILRLVSWVFFLFSLAVLFLTAVFL